RLMVASLAGQETVAEQPAGPPHEMALSELGRVVDEYAAHLVGVREQKGIPGPQPEDRDVALGPGQAGQEAIGAGPEPWALAQQRQRGRKRTRHQAWGVRRRAVHRSRLRCRSNAGVDRHGMRRPNERTGCARSWLTGVSCTKSPPGASTRAISTSASAARAI